MALAVVGVLVLVAGLAFATSKIANRLVTSSLSAPATTRAAVPTPTTAASGASPTTTPTIIKQSTQPLSGGQIRVTDAADGLALVLPAGWQQAPTSTRQLETWLKAVQRKNPGLRSLSSPQMRGLLDNVALFAVYTKGRSLRDVEYMMVMRAPQPLPPLNAGLLPEIRRGIAATPGLRNVQCRMTTVAGDPAILATMTTRVTPAAASAPVTLRARAYFVNSPIVNGFYAYFYTVTSGDPRGDIAGIMGTFDPRYTG